MKKFYIKQKVFSIGENFDIYNEENQAVYKVKGSVFAIPKTFFIFDIKNDKEIYSIKKKIFSFLPTYYLYKEEQLITTIHKNFTIFNHKITIDDNSDKNITVEGNFIAHSFNIYKDSNVVATIEKKWFSFGDSYEITINDEIDFEFYLTLVIIIDNAIHNNTDNSNNNNNY